MLPWAKRVLWSLAIGTAVVFPLVPSAALRDVTQSVVSGVALAIAWTFLLQRRDLLARGWGTLVSAVSLLCVSDAVAAFEVHVVDHAAHLSLSNVMALSGYALLGLGVVQFERQRSRGRQLPGAFEASIFALGALTPVTVFLIIPVVQDDSVALAGRATTIAFALADLVVMTVIARLLLTSSSQALSLVFLSGALFLSLLGDFWAGLSGQGHASALVPVRMLWMFAFILFGAGVAHPSMRDFTQGATWVDDTSSKRRVWLMGVGQAMPPLTLAVAWALGGTPYDLVIAVSGLFVSLLVSFRVTGLLDRISEQSTQLAELARSDELTGLHNRRSWNHELARACARARDHGDHLAIGLIDLDHFKSYNDTHGHLVGDRLLRDAAGVWQQILRPGDVLARYGGEEFAVILPSAGLQEAVALLDEMREATPEGQSFSAGVALWTRGCEPADTVAAADAALYRAKRAGRNRVLPAQDCDVAVLPGHLDALRVVVQPIVRAADLQVVGYEALSRFPNDEDPSSVFSQAHEHGYGDLLEGLAVTRALGLPGRPEGATLHANVSVRAARSPRFWDALPGDLTGLVVELREDRDGLDDATLRTYVERFRGLGARIALDGIGVRATDLARVVTLRPDMVKVDRSLVQGCEGSEGQVEVIRMLVDFARSHGAEPCVAGVETAEAFATVRSTGTELVQGFLVAHPQESWDAPGEPEELLELEVT